MNIINMPGFTAEESLYQTSNHYFTAGGSFLSNGNTTVTPQACRFWYEAPICGGLIIGGAAICTASCLAGGGPAGGYPCYLCWTSYLGVLYGFCRDCIPKWMKDLIDIFEGGGGSGGGGGGPPGGGYPARDCGCPVGTRCCGGCHLVPGQGRVCDDGCVRPGEECP